MWSFMLQGFVSLLYSLPINQQQACKLLYTEHPASSFNAAAGAGANPASPANTQMPTLCLSCATAAAMAAGLAVASGAN
jgi:hypothetical protein